MRIIAIVETEDCGPFAVLDPEAISVIKCSDFYLAATYCAFTGRALTSEINSDCADKLIANGVKCLDFNDDLPINNASKDKKKKD
jgi:hypothetical protein